MPRRTEVTMPPIVISRPTRAVLSSSSASVCYKHIPAPRHIHQGMSGEINAYQVPLLVQPVEITPTFCLRNFGSGYVHYIFSAEQGVDRCRLICLITVAIAHQCLNKDFILGIDGKNTVRASTREAVKTTGKGKTFQVSSCCRHSD